MRTSELCRMHTSGSRGKMVSTLPWRTTTRYAFGSSNIIRSKTSIPPASCGLASVAEHTNIQAAPPIDLTNLPPLDASNARIIPESRSYFTSRPRSTDRLLELQKLALRYQTLPVVKPAQAPRTSWRTLTEYRLLVGETVQASKHGKVVEILKRLNRIHPAVIPKDVKQTLEFFKRNLDRASIGRKPAVIDEDGKTFQVGKRKSSHAKVFLVQGEGQVLINEKPLNEVFARPHDRDSALWALRATDRLDKYNVWALLSGGGTTGQAESLSLGIAKALLVFEPSLKPALRRAGCVTRDPRRVERKKPGHVKARKMPAWVKR